MSSPCAATTPLHHYTQCSQSFSSVYLTDATLSTRLELLKDEFLSVPVRHITNVLKQQKTLFKTHGVLEEQLRRNRLVATPFSKIRSRPKRGIELILIERGSQLPKELHAAKKKKTIEASKRSFLTVTRERRVALSSD